MKTIKTLFLMMFAAICFTACGDDESVNNIVSEFSLNDEAVAAQKAKSHKNKAILLVAFGSTWTNSFAAFDETKKAYEAEFPEYDVYLSFSSDICINRASAGEHGVSRDYYEPRYLLHAIGAAKYSEVRVQSLQVIPGEEFANVVASVKKFANNGYLASAHLDDDYLANVKIYLGMPLLNTADGEGNDVSTVADILVKLYSAEGANGTVAFMGHGNPDSYDTFKANKRYAELQEALQAKAGNKNWYVGTVDAPGMYKQDVLADMHENGIKSGKLYLHTLMSIAGDHAHNDMAGGYDGAEGYWDEEDPESEENSWFEFFSHNDFTAQVPLGSNKEPLGLLELPQIRKVWMQHTKDAELLEDAYHSMYPED